MKQASRIVALVSALTGSAMFGSDQILPLFNIKGLPPSFAQYWPVALFIAAIVHQAAGIVNTWLRDQQPDSIAAGTQPTNPNPVTKSPLPAIAAMAILSTAVLLAGCAQNSAFLSNAKTTAGKFNSDVKAGLAWAQTPAGQTTLNDFIVLLNAGVQAAGGGAKSQANVAAASAIVRSLESGQANQIPSSAAVVKAVNNYIPGGANPQIVAAIQQIAASAPNANGGLEAAAQKIDAASAATPMPAKAAWRNPLDDVYALCARHFVHYRHTVALR